MPQEDLNQWQKIGPRKRAGVLVPLFSVYSRKSLGIGDFNDLKLLIDWCRNSGNSILQLLPLNEVGASFCPYDSLSSFALEPAYIFLETLVNAQEKSIRNEIKEVAQLFPPGKPHLDYRIKREKIQLLKDIFRNKQAVSLEMDDGAVDSLSRHPEASVFERKEMDGAEGAKGIICLNTFREENKYWLSEILILRKLSPT